MPDRRTFLASLSALGALRARAQAPAPPRRIGYISLRAARNAFDDVFVASLRERGYHEGRNIAIDHRFAGGDFAKLERMAAEIVALRPDVIVVTGPATRYAARATSAIPIVTILADPVGQGFAKSLARPGGNVTGITLQSTDLAQKRLQLLRELVPGLRTVAVLAVVTGTTDDAQRRDAAVALAAEVSAAAKRASVDLSHHTVQSGGELPRAFANIRRARAQAVIVQLSPLMYDFRTTVFALAEEARLPALYETRGFVDDGGLLSYGPDLDDIYRRLAGYVDRILRGAKPADMAIEQPGKFELVVNLAAAKAVRLAVPQAVLLRADDVVR